MGDGAILNKGLILCTDSYSILVVVKLINVLKIKYDIKTFFSLYIVSIYREKKVLSLSQKKILNN